MTLPMKVLNLPLHHLDKHFYEANWVERKSEEFLKIQEDLIRLDKWILDGNSIHSLEMRYSKADLVLYFNYPRWICYIRILKRFLHPDQEIDDRAPGCREMIRFSLLRYLWRFEKRVAAPLALLQSTYPTTRFVEINGRRDLQKIKNEFLGPQK